MKIALGDNLKFASGRRWKVIMPLIYACVTVGIWLFFSLPTRYSDGMVNIMPGAFVLAAGMIAVFINFPGFVAASTLGFAGQPLETVIGISVSLIFYFFVGAGVDWLVGYLKVDAAPATRQKKTLQSRFVL